VLAQVRDTGWTHHIPRLMVLGSRALQDGWDPAAVTDWFHRCFVDGYDWVMLPNVVGMSQYADGGLMTTKPYTSGGAYIHRMSDPCGPCAYRPPAPAHTPAPTPPDTGPSCTATAPGSPPTTVPPAPSRVSTASRTCPNSSRTRQPEATPRPDREPVPACENGRFGECAVR
jgi:hypothetical protein